MLHVLRYRRDDLDALVDAINATGYGLTFGLHTRLDETVAHVTARVKAGNLYVNRNVIGAVVGVQPFGGRGLSGTGPKAGGPLYLGRLVARAPVPMREGMPHTDEALIDFARWLEERGHAADGAAARDMAERSGIGLVRELAGPVGETNLYGLHSRGRVLLVPETDAGLRRLLAAALATGNTAVVDGNAGLAALSDLPPSVAARVSTRPTGRRPGRLPGRSSRGTQSASGASTPASPRSTARSCSCRRRPARRCGRIPRRSA